MSAATALLRRFGIFDEFTAEELAEVARLCREEQHSDGVRLFAEGDQADRLYLVLDGKVSLEKKVQLGRSGSSRQATVSIQGPGQAIGWSSLVAPHIYTMSGICIEPARLLVIDSRDMRQFMVRRPEAGLRLMDAIATLVRGRLEATTKTLTYFLSIISHELKSPLAAVENYLQVMLGGYAGELSDRQLRMLERSAVRVRELRSLINDVLDLARMQPEHIQADFELFDPAEICAESIEDVRLAAEERRIKLKVEAPAGLQPILGARRRLRQVCSNLLSNAVKYSPEGSTVILQVREEPDSLIVEVTDEGIGIPADEQGHIFEDFFRATNIGQAGGTGLGLSIVKKIVDAHDGEIWFESPYAPGKRGARFTVVIPRQPGRPAAQQKKWEAAPV